MAQMALKTSLLLANVVLSLPLLADTAGSAGGNSGTTSGAARSTAAVWPSSFYDVGATSERQKPQWRPSTKGPAGGGGGFGGAAARVALQGPLCAPQWFFWQTSLQ